MLQNLDVKEVIKILPHRYPFLLVDRIERIDMENRIIEGRKNLTINEPFFQGHFPDAPLMPGVLMIESLAQLGGVLLHLLSGTNKIAVLLSIKQAKFRNSAHPGDVLDLWCEALQVSHLGGRIKGIARVGDKVAAQTEIGFALVEKESI